MPDKLAVTVLNALDVGVIILDDQQRIVHWNDWLAGVSRVPKEAAVGKLLAEVFPKARLTRVLGCITDALETGISSVITQSLNPDLFPLTTRVGKRLLHNVTVGAVERQKPFTHCIIQILDVTSSTE